MSIAKEIEKSNTNLFVLWVNDCLRVEVASERLRLTGTRAETYISRGKSVLQLHLKCCFNNTRQTFGNYTCPTAVD